MERTFHVAAYAVVVDDERRILLTRRRDDDAWVLPGGSAHPGEPPWETVVRETHEETGVRVELERLVGVYVARDENDLVLAFLCRQVAGEAQPSDERAEVRWLSSDDLPPELGDRDRQRIEDALAGGGPRLRDLAGGDEPPPPGVR